MRTDIEQIKNKSVQSASRVFSYQSDQTGTLACMGLFLGSEGHKY